MTGVIHSLSTCITSALAVKPSTVYVLRVENTQTHDVWHLRRCFSEFCDLRERMLVLIEGGSPSASGTSTANGSAQNSPTMSSLTARRLLGLNPSFRSGSSPGSNANSPRSTGSAGTGPMHERFPYLYNKFPRRQFFGSRTKKVIEQRTLALNQFLQETLWFMREVKTQHNIAMYFSLMTQLEVFFDCANHSAKVTSSTSSPGTTVPAGLCPAFYTPFTSDSPPAIAETSPQPVMMMPFSKVASSPEIDCNTKDAANRARAVAARGFWHAPPNNGHEDDESDEEADDYEERKVLKKTISCFLNHDVRERSASNPASRFVAALQSRASERDQVITAADAWAVRIEIAGIPSTEALRQRNNKNQAMLIKQYSSSVLASKTGDLNDRGDALGTEKTLYAVKDQSSHVRHECHA